MGNPKHKKNFFHEKVHVIFTQSIGMYRYPLFFYVFMYEWTFMQHHGKWRFTELVFISFVHHEDYCSPIHSLTIRLILEIDVGDGDFLMITNYLAFPKANYSNKDLFLLLDYKASIRRLSVSGWWWQSFQNKCLYWQPFLRKHLYLR